MAETPEFLDRVLYFQRNSCWAAFTTRDSNIEHQQVFRTADRPIDLIPQLWEKDYRVKMVTYAGNTWITVAERLHTPFVEQNISFEAKWDQALAILGMCVDTGRRVHWLHFAHGQWVIVSDKHTQEPKPKQYFNMFETGFPHEFLNKEVWPRNRMVHHCAYGDKMWVIIAEDIPIGTEVIQGLILKNFPVSLVNEFPTEVMHKVQKDGKKIKCIDYDDADRAYGMIYEKSPFAKPQGLSVSTQFPTDFLKRLDIM